MKRAAMMLVVALFVLIDSRIAWSWSGDGHRTVGAVADLILERYPNVRDRVASILGGNSLAEVSVWADCAKGYRYCHRALTDEEKAFTSQNRAHHAFHYTDVPIQQSAYHAGTAGAAENDIVAVSAHAIRRPLARVRDRLDHRVHQRRKRAEDQQQPESARLLGWRHGEGGHAARRRARSVY